MFAFILPSCFIFHYYPSVSNVAKSVSADHDETPLLWHFIWVRAICKCTPFMIIPINALTFFSQKCVF